jgi:nicotinate-nucleotide adenylyltransferase
MVELLVEGHDRLELSRLEEFRDGPSYTIDLLRHFRRSSSDEIFFIIGADSLSDLPDWKDPGGILELATLVVFPRTGYDPVLAVDGEAGVIFFEEPLIDISSSEIRRELAAGRSVDRYLTPAVRDYISSRSLYS